jgi:hypothetical protein
VTANSLGAQTASSAAVEPIGIATDYLTLISAFRKRVSELRIPYETIDALAGWTSTYASKLLAEEPIKFMGPMALDVMLGVLGVKIAIFADPAKLEKIKQHRDFTRHKINMNTRIAASGNYPYVALRITRQHLQSIAPAGGRARQQKLTPK